MGDTAIDWATKCWNVVAGCSRVSTGCEHCWALRTTHRLAAGTANRSGRYDGLVKRLPDGRLDWTGEVRCLPERLEEPMHWRTPQTVFVCSQADLFNGQVPYGFIWAVWQVMRFCSHHRFLVLTKRHERMTRFLVDHLWGEPLGNVWLGCTAENQEQADKRIPILLQVPAVRHWCSIEPLLGPVDLTRWLLPDSDGVYRDSEREPVDRDDPRQNSLSWVVCAGESGGPDDRRLVTHLGDRLRGEIWTPKQETRAWVRSLRDQCQVARVPFFWKGWGGPTAHSGGNLLDGREWRERPSEVPT